MTPLLPAPPTPCVSVLSQCHVADSVQLNPVSLCPGVCQVRAEEGEARGGGRTLLRFVMCQPWPGPQGPDRNKTLSLEAGSQGVGRVQTKAGRAWEDG